MSETLLNGNPEPAKTGIQPNSTVTGNPEPNPNPAPAKFDFKSMLGDAGEFSENWRDGLPEGIRGEHCLDNIKNISALANSYVHAQKAIGANKVALPNENSTEEDWTAFYKACGRPESETAYTTDGVGKIERHNERKNKNYGNLNVVPEGRKQASVDKGVQP
jgi:hypothetical protein